MIYVQQIAMYLSGWNPIRNSYGLIRSCEVAYNGDSGPITFDETWDGNRLISMELPDKDKHLRNVYRLTLTFVHKHYRSGRFLLSIVLCFA